MTDENSFGIRNKDQLLMMTPVQLKTLANLASKFNGAFDYLSGELIELSNAMKVSKPSSAVRDNISERARSCFDKLEIVNHLMPEPAVSATIYESEKGIKTPFSVEVNNNKLSFVASNIDHRTGMISYVPHFSRELVMVMKRPSKLYNIGSPHVILRGENNRFQLDVQFEGNYVGIRRLGKKETEAKYGLRDLVIHQGDTLVLGETKDFWGKRIPGGIELHFDYSK